MASSKKAVHELEHDLIAPMQVGEDEHQRPLARERLEVRQHRPQCLATRAGRVDVGAFAEPAEQVQQPV